MCTFVNRGFSVIVRDCETIKQPVISNDRSTMGLDRRQEEQTGDTTPCDTGAMSDQTLLQFDFKGAPLSFPVVETGRTPSPFTGGELRRLKTEVTVSPQESELVKEFLATKPFTDSEGDRWSGNLDVESYTDDGPRHLTIAWTETEHLQADSVEFEGLTLTPTEGHYEERQNDDGSIVVAFQATLTADETDRLRALVPSKKSEVRYWPVVRRGISDNPRNMRLGRVLWQQFDDGMTGQDITLVDEAYDSSDESNAFLGLAGEPMVGNLVQQVSGLLVRFETLLAELEAAGTVAPEAVERVRASADTLGAIRRHIFFEVSDLSKW